MDSPIAVESDGRVGQNSKHETDGRPGVAIDTEKAALLGVLPSRAGDDDEVSRPSWMHRLQFHGLEKEKSRGSIRLLVQRCSSRRRPPQARYACGNDRSIGGIDRFIDSLAIPANGNGNLCFSCSKSSGRQCFAIESSVTNLRIYGFY